MVHMYRELVIIPVEHTINECRAGTHQSFVEY